MATTGFWPVKGSLKDVLNYAENPDKTTDRKFLDEDLWNVLQYAGNVQKTDQRMYVSGINCPPQRAYEVMMATKNRYGKLGGNVAYHGYQSFREGEVTPEEAHRIGMETARRIWGEEYEILVTTHLNTENIHNHLVLNSVSFRTGRKFENHISDHYKLREISDAVCREHGKSVLEGASFYGGEKDGHWVRKNGGMTHRDMLKRDIEKVLHACKDMYDFEAQMRALGYSFPRDGDYAHRTIIAPGWKRPIRLDSIGYSKDALWDRFDKNYEDPNFYRVRNYNPPYKPKRYPLLELEKQLEWRIDHTQDGFEVLLDAMFYVFIALLRLAVEENAYQERRQPLSPELRAEVRKMEEYSKQNQLLGKYGIHTAQELLSFREERNTQLEELSAQRQKIYNKARRAAPEEKERLNAEARAISTQMKPLREERDRADRIYNRSVPRIQELLELERNTEIETQRKMKARNYER